MNKPIVELAYAILLTASEKSVPFRIRSDGAEYVVEHLVDGEAVEELRGPSAVLTAVIRRMSVMANLPTYSRGEVSVGRIHLQPGEANYYFAVRCSGHGPQLALEGRVLSEAEYQGE